MSGNNENKVQTIRCDIVRGLIAFNDYITDSGVTKYCAFSLFERYFMDILMQGIVSLESYYQGMTDVFEVIFITYLNLEKCSEQKEFFANLERSSQPFYGDCRIFFNNYDVMLSISVMIMRNILEQRKCEHRQMSAQCREILHFIKQTDKALYNELKSINNYEIQGLLYKYQVSCCIHESHSLRFSIDLCRLLLDGSQNAQSFVIAQLVSMAYHVHTKQSINLSKVGKRLNISTEKLNSSSKCQPYELREILSQGVGFILIDENYRYFTTFVDDVMKEYQRERRQQAGIIGGATSGGVIVLGGIIAAIGATLVNKF